MAKRRKSPSVRKVPRKGPSAYAKRLASVARRVGKAQGRGPVSAQTARQVEKFRRGLSKGRGKLLDTYARGFAINEAIATGKLPSLKSVKANPEFRKQLDIIASTSKRTPKGPNSKLAKALVKLGVRDERATYEVGNSPDAGDRTKARAPRKARKSSSGNRGKPGRHS